MERKGTAVVTAEDVKSGLNHSQTVTVEEEKALRMRYGAKVDTQTALPQVHGGKTELQDELMLIEMQLMRQVKARMAAMQAKAKPMTPRNAAKDKIVRALKTKKKN